ncbi:hypothetical protein GCM10027577_35500 [Spirosoma fluminis]
MERSIDVFARLHDRRGKVRIGRLLIANVYKLPFISNLIVTIRRKSYQDNEVALMT